VAKFLSIPHDTVELGTSSHSDGSASFETDNTGDNGTAGATGASSSYSSTTVGLQQSYAARRLQLASSSKQPLCMQWKVADGKSFVAPIAGKLQQQETSNSRRNC